MQTAEYQPAHLISDPVLYGECLSGALYWNDFLNLAKQAGFADPRLVEDHPITIENLLLFITINNSCILFINVEYFFDRIMKLIINSLSCKYKL